jgi:hypothetical protein
MQHQSRNLQWRKSSHSDAEGQCVELAEAGDTVAVRDSKQGDTGAILSFTVGEWRRLFTDIREGAHHQPPA